MAKIFNYIILITGLLLLLAFAGFHTLTGNLLTYMGVVSTSDVSGAITDISIGGILAALFFSLIIGIFTVSAATGGSVQIGTLVVNTTDSRLVGGFVSFLLTWGLIDLYSVFNVARSFGQTWITFISALFIFPMMAAYAIAMIQYWRGSDI